MKKLNDDFYVSGKRILLTLIENTKYIRLLDWSEKKYCDLVNWILNNQDSLDAFNSDLPLLKDIAKILGVENQKVTKYLKDIYNDIIELNCECYEKFVNKGQILCCFTFKSFDRSGYFNLGLDSVPRINEEFQFDFIEPKVGYSRFYLRSVEHRILNGIQEVNISASIDEQYSYIKLLKEKAYLTRNISWYEYNGYQVNENNVIEKLLNLGIKL